jgi:hypothetical protein
MATGIYWEKELLAVLHVIKLQLISRTYRGIDVDCEVSTKCHLLSRFIALSLSLDQQGLMI